MERKLSRAVHVTRLRHRLVNRTLGSATGPGTGIPWYCPKINHIGPYQPELAETGS